MGWCLSFGVPFGVHGVVEPFSAAKLLVHTALTSDDGGRERATKPTWATKVTYTWVWKVDLGRAFHHDIDRFVEAAGAVKNKGDAALAPW